MEEEKIVCRKTALKERRAYRKAARAEERAARKEERRAEKEEQKKAGKSFSQEFKAFITRGNVVDMAVGMVVGSAFTGIVNSLVNDIITPLIGFSIGRMDLSAFKIVLSEDSSVNYGLFLQKVINFFVIAFCIFLVVRLMNRIREKNDELMKKLKEGTDEFFDKLLKREDEEAPKSEEKAEEQAEEQAPEKAEEPAACAEEKPADKDLTELMLLKEIRDLLKEK